MKWIKFIKKNWLPLALAPLIIVLLGDKACRPSTDKEDLKKSREKVSVLEADNLEKDGVIEKAVENARVYEARVAEQEELLIESEFIIKGLRKKIIEVPDIVTALPPSELVDETRKILECAQIELTDDGVLFSVECAQTVLIMAEQFSLTKEKLSETEFALSTSKEATQLQKMCTWSVYKIAWGLGSQVMNYKQIIKEKDFQFSLCEKRRKKSFWDGLFRGFVIGAGVTITVIVVIPFFRKLIW